MGLVSGRGGEAGAIADARWERERRFFSGSSACGRRRLAIEFRRVAGSVEGEAAIMADGDGGGAGMRGD